MTSTIMTFLHLWKNFPATQKYSFVYVLLLMLLSSVFELISIGAVIPLLAILTHLKTKSIEYPAIINKLSQLLETESVFIGSLGVIFIFCVVILASASVKLFALKTTTEFTANVGSSLSCTLYKRFLYSPYTWHLQVLSSDLITMSTVQTSRTVSAINSFLLLLSSSITCLFLIIGLFALDWKITISLVLIFAVFYFKLASYTKSRLRSNSIQIELYSKGLTKLLQESLGAIKEIIIGSSQEFNINRYICLDKPKRALENESVFISLFPRYLLEALALMLMAFIGGIAIFSSSEDLVFGILVSMALGIQKLLPAMQQVFAGWATFKGLSSDVESLLGILELDEPLWECSPSKLSFNHQIEVKNLNYYYNHGDKPILSDVSFVIQRGEKVAIVGPSGSGKSTLMDILMGLLPPSSGQILVDGTDIYSLTSEGKNIVSWMKNIAYLDQSVCIIDDTIQNNIAFNSLSSDIDIDKVHSSAKLSHLSSYIESLPNGYYTLIGESGSGLSGGQKQRLALARALYKTSNLLILDEPTSALDGQSESVIFKTVAALPSDVTIVVVTHSSSHLNLFDKVLTVSDGVVSCSEVNC
jgi:ABC-type multidrug transport system fused ATPase/permease subunit